MRYSSLRVVAYFFCPSPNPQRRHYSTFGIRFTHQEVLLTKEKRRNFAPRKRDEIEWTKHWPSPTHPPFARPRPSPCRTGQRPWPPCAVPSAECATCVACILEIPTTKDNIPSKLHYYLFSIQWSWLWTHYKHCARPCMPFSWQPP